MFLWQYVTLNLIINKVSVESVELVSWAIYHKIVTLESSHIWSFWFIMPIQVVNILWNHTDSYHILKCQPYRSPSIQAPVLTSCTELSSYPFTTWKQTMSRVKHSDVSLFWVFEIWVSTLFSPHVTWFIMLIQNPHLTRIKHFQLNIKAEK